MKFSTQCRRCKKVIEFLDVQHGTKIRCPQCSNRMVLKPDTASWLKWLLIPIWCLAIAAIIVVVLLMVEPRFQGEAKDTWESVKKFFGPATGPAKK